MTTGERIRNRRKELGVSAEQLAERLGVSPATIYRYENGSIEKVPGDILPAISKVLATTPAHLMGWDSDTTPIPPGFSPMPELVSVPMVGRIACGEPITAEENLEGYVSVPSAWHATFSLLCRGDSMNPTYQDGDIVAIRAQPTVENGEVAAVRIDSEATLKHVYLHDGCLELRPENPSYQSIILIGEEINRASIEGKAVGICRGV